jgi:hypothetical protein
MEFKQLKQLDPLLQTLTHVSNTGIQTWRVDGLYDLKLAVMLNLKVTFKFEGDHDGGSASFHLQSPHLDDWCRQPHMESIFVYVEGDANPF